MSWSAYKKAPNLVIAQMWKELFEAEGLPACILPEGEIRTWSETSRFVVYVPRGREHIAQEILRKV
ncbi:MAG: hypothetical protein HW397_301 [Dehalococcoidia bacterium]|nr:hypothetical protein [Dehalococcoidia bacterium]